MPDESTTESTSQTTPDAAVINTGDAATGAGTQTAQQTTEAPTEKTFTQADVDRIVQNRLKSAVKAELKKLTGEGDGTPTVDELKSQLSEATQKAQALEARQSVRDYLMDPKNKLNVKAENAAAIEKLVMPDVEFDNGKPSNLKEAIESAKSLAPALFVNVPTSIDANAGRNGQTGDPKDMNKFVRAHSPGFGN
jgi:hypothetical protein